MIEFSADYSEFGGCGLIDVIAERLEQAQTVLENLKGRAPEAIQDQHRFTRQRVANERVWEILLAGLNEKGTTSLSDVEVLLPLTSKWDQGDPYNMYTPLLQDGQHSLTGCVGTALAQAMRYWQYPVVGQGKITTMHAGGPPEPFVREFSTIYQWQDMLDVYEGGENPAERESVGRFVSDAAIGVGTAFYSCMGPWTYFFEAHTALIKYFRYSGDISWIRRSSMSTPQEWADMFQNQLDAGMPSILDIRNDSGLGHAAVVDGYRIVAGMFQVHVNLGWSGAHDGYYSFDDIYGFSASDSAVVNIKPPACSNTGAVAGRVVDSEGVGVPFVEVALFREDCHQTFYCLEGCSTPNDCLEKVGWTSASGEFLIECVRPLDYRIRLRSTEAGDHSNIWYPGNATHRSAAAVSVNINQRLDLGQVEVPDGGEFRALVTDFRGNPIYTRVYFYYENDYIAKVVFTTSQGRLETAHLLPGNYTIWVSDPIAWWYGETVYIDSENVVDITISKPAPLVRYPSNRVKPGP